MTDDTPTTPIALPSSAIPIDYHNEVVSRLQEANRALSDSLKDKRLVDEDFEKIQKALRDAHRENEHLRQLLAEKSEALDAALSGHTPIDEEPAEPVHVIETYDIHSAPTPPGGVRSNRRRIE